MDFSKLFLRGLLYINNAGNNWHRRKSKLISAWCGEISESKKQRINKIILELETRISSISKAICYFEEKTKMDVRESEEQIILLECPSFTCKFDPNGIGYGVKLKNYKSGELKCEKCGSILIAKAEENIENTLLSLGISMP